MPTTSVCGMCLNGGRCVRRCCRIFDFVRGGSGVVSAAASVPGHHVRRCQIFDLLIRGSISGLWAVYDLHCVCSYGPYYYYGPLVVHAAQTLLVASCAVALTFPRVSPRASGAVAALIPLVCMAWSACLVWGLSLIDLITPFEELDGGPPLRRGMAFAYGASLGLVLEALGFELQPRRRKVCVAFHLVSCALFAAANSVDLRQLPADEMTDMFTLAVILTLVCFNSWSLCNELVAEQAVANALVTMTSDAGFWVADDGDTIVRADRRLDTIMGMAMEGTSLSERLSDSDQERFRVTVTEQACTSCHASASHHAGPSVMLLPVTMLGPEARPFQAELFIIAARGKGFFIGLRLSEGLQVEAAVAGQGAEDEAVTRWPSSPAQIWPAPRQATSSASRLLPSSSSAARDLEAATARDAGHVGHEGSCATLATSASYPSTMNSHALEPLEVRTCARGHIVETLLSLTDTRTAQLRDTVLAAIGLCFDHAAGGALIVVADKEAVSEVFRDTPPDDGVGVASPSGAPRLLSSDGGYMTARLRGIHVSTAYFAAAFRDFTEHSATDRWPQDYPDPAARNLPKDGAFLLDASGFRIKCAAKVLGLSAPRSWQGVGTKHEAALACAWAVRGSIVLVRSDGGSVHAVVRSGATVYAHLVLPELQAPPELQAAAPCAERNIAL